MYKCMQLFVKSSTNVGCHFSHARNSGASHYVNSRTMTARARMELSELCLGILSLFQGQIIISVLRTGTATVGLATPNEPKKNLF